MGSVLRILRFLATEICVEIQTLVLVCTRMQQCEHNPSYLWLYYLLFYLLPKWSGTDINVPSERCDMTSISSYLIMITANKNIR